MNFRQIIFPLILALLLFYTGLCLSRTFPAHLVLNCVITALVFILMIGSQVVYRLALWPRASLPNRIFVWTGSITMGFWATYILFAVVIDLGNLILLLLHMIIDPAALPDNETTQTLLHQGFLALIVIACLIAVVGLFQAVNGPMVKRVTVHITNLPAALAGLTIAQISDLHIGATIQRDYINNIVEEVMKLSATIIAVTGDLADGKVQDLNKFAEPLATLQAPLGVYFVTGNHEYYSGALEWLSEVRRLGMITLLNDNRVVEYNGEPFMIAGVTDITSHHFIPTHRSSPAQAISGKETATFKLLLAHQPESCIEAEKAGFDLQLSGHTHAGQFFPFSVLVRLAKRYYSGLYRRGKMWIYVNAGTGYWGAANRFGVPSEITLLTLQQA